MESKKILQIVDSLNLGGTERMSVNIFNGLTTDNIQNVLVVSRDKGPLYNFISNKDGVYFLNKIICVLLSYETKMRKKVPQCHSNVPTWVDVCKKCGTMLKKVPQCHSKGG